MKFAFLMRIVLVTVFLLPFVTMGAEDEPPKDRALCREWMNTAVSESQERLGNQIVAIPKSIILAIGIQESGVCTLSNKKVGKNLYGLLNAETGKPLRFASVQDGTDKVQLVLSTHPAYKKFRANIGAPVAKLIRYLAPYNRANPEYASVLMQRIRENDLEAFDAETIRETQPPVRQAADAVDSDLTLRIDSNLPA